MSALQQLVHFILKIDDSYDSTSITTVTIALQSLGELFEKENGKLFVQNIEELISVCATLVNQKSNAELMEMSQLYAFLSNVVQKYPKTLKTKKERITRLYKIAFDILTQISSETTNEWLNPPNGFHPNINQDDEESASNLTISSEYFISNVVQFKDALLHIHPLFLEYMNKAQDWRYQYAALVITSQIAVGSAKPKDLGLIVQWALKATEHNHPRIRYAAIQVIEQFSIKLNPLFQEMYYEAFVNVCPRLLNDPVPRVVAHTLFCTTNFFTNCKQLWKIQNLLGLFLNSIIHCIKTGNTLLKWAALSTLQAFGQMKNAYGPNLSNIFEIGFEIIDAFAGQEGYKQVISIAIAMLTILLVKQDKGAVEPYLDRFITKFFANRENISKYFLFFCWKKLCTVYRDLKQVNAVFQFLLETCQQMDNGLGNDTRVNGLRALAATFECFKEQVASFAEQTLEYAEQIFINTSLNLQLRKEAVLLMVTVVSEIKPTQPTADIAAWKSQGETIYNFICNAIDQNFLDFFDASDLSFLFQALKNIIIVLGSTFRGPQLISLAEKQINFASKISEAYTASTLMKETDDEPLTYNQLGDSVTDTNKTILKDAMNVIPNILEYLVNLSSQSAIKMQIVAMLSCQIEKSPEKNNLMSIYCLSLSDTLIRNLSYIEIRQIWFRLIDIYVNFSQHPNSWIRYRGSFGLRLTFIRTPKGILGKEEISKMLLLLSNSFTLPFSQNQDKSYRNLCKDTVIAALGSLLKNYGSEFPDILTPTIFEFWLSYLPLNTDTAAGYNQQLFLMELLANNPGIIIKQVNDLKTVYQIYAKFIMRQSGKKYKGIIQKTKDSLIMIKNWIVFPGATDYLWNNLCDSHRNALTQLLEK